MSDKLTDDILKEIKQRGCCPKPKWQFLLKDQVILGFSVAATLLGGLAMAAMIFVLTDNDWDVFSNLDKGFFEYLIVSLPYIWFILLGLLAFLAFYNFKHTKSGYRYGAASIIAVSLAVSIIMGCVAYRYGLGEYIHNFFMDRLPLYAEFTCTKEDIWIYPEKGLLSGQVIGMNDDHDFTIDDYIGRNWQILITEDTVFESNLHLRSGIYVKIIGKIKAPLIFQARVVRPW